MSDLQRGQNWHELETNYPLEHHSLYRKVIRETETMTPGRVLEIGCLDGRLLRYLADRGWEVHGLDIQPQAAPYILEHDASEPFPFAGGQFDLVIAAEVIEHLVDTQQFLEHCSQVLKPQGLLILTTPNLVFGVNRLRMLVGKRPAFAYADFHVRMFIWSDLESKLSRRFTIEHLYGSHVLVGRHRGRYAEAFAWIGDRLPRLAAHFIVICRSR